MDTQNSSENSTKSKQKENLKKYAFKKGQSGNPSGRPKLAPELKDMLKAASYDAVKLLIETLNDDKQKPDLRVKCAEIILDRHLGKPKQAVDLETVNVPKIVIAGSVKD